MKSRIVVIGSSNTDMVIKTTRLPQPGETILGGNFFMTAGGKGANQAVAAARLGGDVKLIAKVGSDIFGEKAKTGFAKEGIDISYILTDPTHPSGIALITVDEMGENCIVVAPGANNALTRKDLELQIDVLRSAGIILVQLEIPIETVNYLAGIVEESGSSLVLNPAPVCQLSDELFRRVNIITPNKKEAEMLTGVKIVDNKSAREAALELHKKGVRTVIITLGVEGALLYNQDAVTLVPSPKVRTVDSTAAGDVFNGALVVALAEGMPMKDAVEFSCRAASIAVTRLGAQASAPYRSEMDV